MREMPFGSGSELQVMAVGKKGGGGGMGLFACVETSGDQALGAPNPTRSVARAATVTRTRG